MEHLSPLYAERARLAYLVEHGRGTEQQAATQAYPLAQDVLARAISGWSFFLTQSCGHPFSAIKDGHAPGDMRWCSACAHEAWESGGKARSLPVTLADGTCRSCGREDRGIIPEIDVCVDCEQFQ